MFSLFDFWLIGLIFNLNLPFNYLTFDWKLPEIYLDDIFKLYYICTCEWNAYIHIPCSLLLSPKIYIFNFFVVALKDINYYLIVFISTNLKRYRVALNTENRVSSHFYLSLFYYKYFSHWRKLRCGWYCRSCLTTKLSNYSPNLIFKT